jgi:hypothetical protein
MIDNRGKNSTVIMKQNKSNRQEKEKFQRKIKTQLYFFKKKDEKRKKYDTIL